MLKLNVPFVLASQSPRRRRLLRQIGLEFEIDPSEKPEIWPGDLAPGGAVEELARQKATDVSKRHKDSLVLGADTIVALHDSILGKPETEAEAVDMLQNLSGKTHNVYTGICLVDTRDDVIYQTHATTRVTFANLSEHEIAAYIATGSPMDKAGAYGIQDDLGALLVESIQGDFYNVVGLPLRTLYLGIQNHFPHLLAE